MAFLVGALALAVGIARWIAGLEAPGDDGLVPDVVGFLRHTGLTKRDEITEFYGALIVAPICVLLARGVVARLGALRWTDLAGAPVALAGLTAVASVAYAFLYGARSASSCVVTPGISLVLGPLVAISARRIDRARERLLPLAFAQQLALTACALTLVLLAAGPRIDRDLKIEFVLVRALAVFAGVALTCCGIAGALGTDRLSRAPAVVACLLPIRLAPTNSGWVVLWCAVTLLAAIVVRRRPAITRARSSAFLFALFVLAFAFDPDPNGTIDLFHAGEWLTPASEMLAGATPYRDVYLQHGLIANVLRAFWTFTAFGPTLAADRLTSAALGAATHAAFAWMLCGLLRSRFLASAIAVLLASPGLWLNVRLLPLFVVVGSLAMHVRATRSAAGAPQSAAHRRTLVWCGAWTGVALAYSLDTGLYALAIALVFLLIDRLDRGRGPWLAHAAPFATFSVGVIVALAPFVAWLSSHGALGTCLENCRDQIRLHTSVWGLPHPSFAAVLTEFRASPTEALAGGAPASLVAGIAWVGLAAFLAVRAQARAFDLTAWLLLLVTIAGAVTYRTALGRSDAGHFGYGTAMLWAVVAVLGEAALTSARVRAPLVLRAAPIALLLAWWIAAGTPLYAAARHCRALSIEPQHHSGNGFSSVPVPRMRDVLLPDTQAKAIASLDAFLNDRLSPSETYFEYSNAGALWFLLDRRCPTRYVQAAYAATAEMQRRMIDDLERSRPPLMIISSVLGSPELDGIRLDERQPLVKQYLETRYRYAGDFAFGLVFERVRDS